MKKIIKNNRKQELGVAVEMLCFNCKRPASNANKLFIKKEVIRIATKRGVKVVKSNLFSFKSNTIPNPPKK